MCGIVGILGKEPVAWKLVDALKRLEYRGYDSSGVAVINNNEIERVRAPGKLVALEEELRTHNLGGNIGIGHTRWATHGAANEINAHPHQASDVVLVHNGIIENFRQLREELEKDGVVFTSQTDTETVPHLISRELKAGKSPREAVQATLARLDGAFSLAILFKGEEDLMIGARKGSPLAVGHGDGEMFLGSDAIALAPFTNRVTYLEDGDWVVLNRDGFELLDKDNRPVIRPLNFTQASALMADKGKYRHFMAKEIAEQSDVIGHTLSEYVDLAELTVKMPQDFDYDFSKLDRISIVACGTAAYAGLVAKYWFERLARLPVEVDVASEFRYREAPLNPDGLSLVISQSGETADTLAALRYCTSQGQKTVAVVNVPESTISRESSMVLRTYAGPEVGVASTKAFTCQLMVLALVAIYAARQRGFIDEKEERRLVAALAEVPRHTNAILSMEDQIAAIAHKISAARDVMFLGRGVNYPIALEGALKLKEISYIHAEGYAAGELKHGPIALIDEDVPVIVIAPHDDLYEKTISNMQEVAARGGKIVLISNDNADSQSQDEEVFDAISVPMADPFIAPFLFTIPVQLLAYHAAVFKGTDVDQPRNLAKAVTVE